MTDNSAKNGTNTGDAKKHVLRLVAFFIACLVVGGIVLFLLFAPAINPSFINEVLFYPEHDNTISDDWLSDDDEQFPKELNDAFHRMRRSLNKTDFAELQVPQPEDVSFKASDGTELHGWYFKTTNDRGTVLLNWNGICDMRLPVLLGYIKVFEKAGLSVFAYDFRGFGKSGGTPATLGTFEDDGVAAYDYLLNDRKIPADHIVLMGSQLGAHLALVQNAHKTCKAIILETPWTNLKKFIDEIPAAQAMSIVPEPFYPKGAFDNTQYVKGQHPPLLFVLTSDLPDHGGNLLQAASDPKQSVRLRSAPKNYIPLLRHVGSQYTKSVNELLK
ncbi:MAG TPA: alpha/beta fold hydrolase [Planktothrix sp.]|jgi:hypothetical protein